MKTEGKEKIDASVLLFSLALRAEERGTHSEVGVDVPLNDSSDLSLELLHQSSSELGSGLSSRVGLCGRGKAKGRVSLESTHKELKSSIEGRKRGTYPSKARYQFGCTR